MGSFKEDPTNNKLVVRLGTGTKMKFLALMTELNLSPSLLINHLVDLRKGSTLHLMRTFRFILAKRLKKGISYVHIQEMKKLRDLINLSLENIER